MKAVRVKEFPQLLAGQRAVLQLCYASNQIMISCRVGAVRLYVMSPLLPVEKPLQRALQLLCTVSLEINKPPWPKNIG